jgi:hypothetical protein
VVFFYRSNSDWEQRRAAPTSLVIALWIVAASRAVAILAILFDAGLAIVWRALAV